MSFFLTFNAFVQKLPFADLFVINPLDHTSLQYGMKSQSPKEKLDPGKQDSLEDLHRYGFITASTFMGTYITPWVQWSFNFPLKLQVISWSSWYKQLVTRWSKCRLVPLFPWKLEEPSLCPGKCFFWSPQSNLTEIWKQRCFHWSFCLGYVKVAYLSNCIAFM